MKIELTQVEYAQKLLDEYGNRQEKVIRIIEKEDPLSCEIICSTGRKYSVFGYWAYEILNRQEI